MKRGIQDEERSKRERQESRRGREFGFFRRGVQREKGVENVQSEWKICSGERRYTTRVRRV